MGEGLPRAPVHPDGGAPGFTGVGWGGTPGISRRDVACSLEGVALLAAVAFGLERDSVLDRLGPGVLSAAVDRGHGNRRGVLPRDGLLLLLDRGRGVFVRRRRPLGLLLDLRTFFWGAV